MSTYDLNVHELAAYERGYDAGWKKQNCIEDYYPEGNTRNAYLTGYKRGQNDINEAIKIAYSQGFRRGTDGYSYAQQFVVKNLANAFDKGYEDGVRNRTEQHTTEEPMKYEYNEMELRALASGYHHGASGDLPFNSYAVGSKAFEAYEWGYENGADNYDDRNEYNDNANRNLDAEDFPEHEGLDNLDYNDTTEMASPPDEVFIDMPEDEVVQRVAEKWNLNEFAWDDTDDRPSIAIQIKDGEVYDAFATIPIKLYIVDAVSTEVPDGLRINEDGNLDYASAWHRGYVNYNYMD